jgi:hypothetical protein
VLFQVCVVSSPKMVVTTAALLTITPATYGGGLGDSTTLQQLAEKVHNVTTAAESQESHI